MHLGKLIEDNAAPYVSPLAGSKSAEASSLFRYALPAGEIKPTK